ncbi:MAG: hypothetical protein ACK4NC_02310 [Candidatus Gracilibacteria bacterium]
MPISHTVKPEATLDFHRNPGANPAVIEALASAFLEESIHQKKSYLRIITGNSAIAPRIEEGLRKYLSTHTRVAEITSVDLENGMLHALDLSIEKSA